MPHGALYTPRERSVPKNSSLAFAGRPEGLARAAFLRSAALAFSVLQSAETRFDVIVTDLD